MLYYYYIILLVKTYLSNYNYTYITAIETILLLYLF